MTTGQRNPTERRENDRVRLTTEVRIDTDSQFFAGVTGNISRGGIFVATYELLEVGTRLIVELSLPSSIDRPIYASGTVRWLRDTEGGVPGMGIVFDELSPHDESAIRAFCRLRAPLVYERDPSRLRDSDPSLIMDAP